MPRPLTRVSWTTPLRGGGRVLLHLHKLKGHSEVTVDTPNPSGHSQLAVSVRRGRGVPSSGCGFLSPTCTMVLL